MKRLLDKIFPAPLIVQNTAWIFQILIVMSLLIGCGTAISPQADSSSGQASLTLPTSRPTVAPSPVSTRVMPVSSLTPAPSRTITPIPDEALGLVVEVFDGDTIAVVLDGDPARLAYKVRYLGIDAPSNTSSDPWGVVAYETNRRLTNLKVVRLVRDETDFDDDGYLLRYVYLKDDLLNARLVREGLARADIEAPNDRFATVIRAAEAEAQDADRGLWGPEPPTATPGAPAPTQTQTAPAETATTTTALTRTPTADATGSVTPTVTGEITGTPQATATRRGTTTPTRTRTRTATPTATADADETPSSSDLRGQ